MPAAGMGVSLNQVFNLTFSNEHAFIQLTPSRSAGLNATNPLIPLWDSTFSASASSAINIPGVAGDGDSGQAFTALPHNQTLSASAEFFFTGTAVSFNGELASLTQDEYDSGDYKAYLAVDSSQAAPFPSGGVLAAASGLDMQTHDARYSTGNGTTLFKGVTLTLAIEAQAPTFADIDQRVEYLVVNGSVNPFFRMGHESNWTVQDHIGGARGQDSIPYNYLKGFETRIIPALTSFTVPDNTSFLMLNGTMGPDLTVAAISCDPQAVSDNTTAQGGGSVEVYNAWEVADSVLYMATLDPKRQYNISVNTDSLPVVGPPTIGLHSVTFFSGLSNLTTTTTGATGSANASTKVKPATIAGAVIGALAGVALTGFIAFLVAKRQLRRRQQNLSKGGPEEFVVDDQNPPCTPYEATMDGRPFMSHASKLHGEGGFVSGPLSAGTSSVDGSQVWAPSRVRYEQEEDGGQVERVEYVPPMYNPDWASRSEGDALTSSSVSETQEIHGVDGSVQSPSITGVDSVRSQRDVKGW